jgi:hypothetical protein
MPMVYSNNGRSFGNKDKGYVLQAGEVILPEGATPAQIAAEFPRYTDGDPTLVPKSISDRQFFQQLAVEGIITQADALASNAAVIPPPLLDIISAMPVEAQFSAKMLLSGATTFDRDHPMTLAIGAAYGWTAAQIDAFFSAAALL